MDRRNGKEVWKKGGSKMKERKKGGDERKVQKDYFLLGTKTSII
jgi:hypothetical protein